MDEHDESQFQDPEDPWRQASERFSSIGAKLRDRYAEIVGDDGPDEDEVRDAIRTIGTAAQSLIESISSSMRDPDVREQVKDASSTFFSAIGQTLSELGEELRDPRHPEGGDRKPDAQDHAPHGDDTIDPTEDADRDQSEPPQG